MPIITFGKVALAQQAYHSAVVALSFGYTNNYYPLGLYAILGLASTFRYISLVGRMMSSLFIAISQTTQYMSA